VFGSEWDILCDTIEDKWLVGERERVSVQSYALECEWVYIRDAVAKHLAWRKVCCVACCCSRALKGRHSFRPVSCAVLRQLWKKNWLFPVSRGLRTCCQGKSEWREAHYWNCPTLCTHYVRSTAFSPRCSTHKKLASVRLRRHHLKQNKRLEHRKVNQQLQQYCLLFIRSPATMIRLFHLRNSVHPSKGKQYKKHL